MFIIQEYGFTSKLPRSIWFSFVISPSQLFRRDNGLVWRQQHVEPAKFNTSREVDDLIAKVEVSQCISLPQRKEDT